MNEQEKYDWMVYVSCMTFNHSPYIVDAMNGFTMQVTNFPFVCAIVDDASTDGEQEVIKKYLNEHFDLEDKSIARHEETDDYVLSFARHKTNLNCHFAVFYLKYNHYSIKKSKLPYLVQWRDKAKYIAVCEGDDYWTHPGKLQMQVDFLESHLDYTMTCNRTQLYSVKRSKMIGENYCYDKSQDIDPKDVINRGGLFISTCSIMYRKEIIQIVPDYWKNCLVGDYPLQIACALRGKIYYFNEIMSVYRVANPNSWMGKQQWGKYDAGRLKVIKSQVEMFLGFAKDYPEYESVFLSKVACHINRGIPSWCESQKSKKTYISFFEEYISLYPLKWKIDLFIQQLRIPKIRGFYLKALQKKYSQKKVIY